MFGKSMRAACLALTAAAAANLAGGARASAACSRESWPEFERKAAAAQAAFQKRDPAPWMALWSHADDVSLMGANGGYEVGWSLVGPRIARISAVTTNGPRQDQVLVTRVGADMGVIVQIENITNLNPDGSVRDVDRLRVTHVARCEGSAWRIIHRQADRLVDVQKSQPH